MKLFLAASLIALGSSPLLSQAPAPSSAPAAPASASPQTPSSAPAPAAAAAPAAATPASAPAQSPASAPVPTPPEVENTDIGFRYSLPPDWEYVPLPPAPKEIVPYPQLIAPKKGDACIESAFTAKHGTPASVVVVLALPFACYGQTMPPGDLANFGVGAEEGLKQTFDLKADPVEATYSLGGHSMWAERVDGTPKGHPENRYIFEIACTVLEKGAVCWMTVAAKWPDLKAFEGASVALDGDPPTALVPDGDFPRKPPSTWYLADRPSPQAH